MYPGGAVDLSASVKAYFALKLVGMSPEHPAMVKARETILAARRGAGVQLASRGSISRLLGQISYDETPTRAGRADAPAEVHAVRPLRHVGLDADDGRHALDHLGPEAGAPDQARGSGIAELFRDDLPPRPNRWKRPAASAGRTSSSCVDKALKLAERVVPDVLARAGRPQGAPLGPRPLRELRRPGRDLPADDLHGHRAQGAGLRRQLAAHAVGPGSPRRPSCIEEDGAVRVQPCLSPIWDTAISTIALADAGLPDFHPALLRSVRWLLGKEVRRPGDWSVRRPGVEPSGWYFEFNNEFYPRHRRHVDGPARPPEDGPGRRPGGRRMHRRGRSTWMLALQNRDGGFAAFDVDIDNQVLTKVPFADHNAMLDPSCADITARVIEVPRRPGPSRPIIRPSPGPSITSGRRRSPRGAGTAAGA